MPGMLENLDYPAASVETWNLVGRKRPEPCLNGNLSTSFNVGRHASKSTTQLGTEPLP